MPLIDKQKITFSNNGKSYMSQFVPRGVKEANIPLNPLIDIFTILLIFLLKSYSAAAFTVPLTPGINVPRANFFSEPHPSVIVSVTNDYILVDGARAAFIKDLKKDDYIINELNSALKMTKSKVYDTKKLDAPADFTGKVIIEADKNIPFSLLQKILYTSGQAGFDKVNLAVIKN